jgi:RNA polymerase sigma-70 factor (ECF subfamily)
MGNTPARAPPPGNQGRVVGTSDAEEFLQTPSSEDAVPNRINEPSLPLEEANTAMDRYANGEDRAFAVVYDRIAPALFAFAFKHTGNAAAAADVMQETFLRIHRSRAHFVRGAPVLRWALAIARCFIIDEARRRRSEKPRTAARSGRLSHDETPEDLLAAKEVLLRLDAELSRLPSLQRTAFELVRRRGFSNAHAASLLRTTVTAIKLRVHRVSERLRAAHASQWSRRYRPVGASRTCGQTRRIPRLETTKR